MQCDKNENHTTIESPAVCPLYSLAWGVNIHGCTLPEHTHIVTQTRCWAAIMVNCDCMIVQMDLLWCKALVAGRVAILNTVQFSFTDLVAQVNSLTAKQVQQHFQQIPFSFPGRRRLRNTIWKKWPWKPWCHCCSGENYCVSSETVYYVTVLSPSYCCVLLG